MAKVTAAADTPKETPPSISFTEKQLKGIGNLSLDDKISMRIECKITEVRRNEYDKGNPISARFSVLSVKILDSEIISKIKNAKTNLELEGIMKED